MISIDKNKKKTRYIAITGGVISGLGKGTVSASVGLILKSQGYKVNMIKIDPYINLDAGTMRPTEHGEVFVTYDGGETDQDMGNYERFLGEGFPRQNNITTGQVYDTVIRRERNLQYQGKCVEVIPHIPDEVKRRIRGSSSENDADFTIIEVGGTVGDYQNVLFLEALREMKLEEEEICFIHVVYLPIPGNIGEMKTKPAQHSVRSLQSQGIQPDFIISRSSRNIDSVRRKKISMFCNVSFENVLSSPDRKFIYEIPLVFKRQGLNKKLVEHFSLDYKKNTLEGLERYIKGIKGFSQKIRIGIVGKYFDIGDFVLEDSYVSVLEAVKYACFHNGLSPEIIWADSKEFEKDPESLKKLAENDAVIVPGGFGSSGVEGKVEAIRYCREHKIPFLGLCYGMQLAVVEYARNVCGLKGANSTEIDPETSFPVIDILEDQKEILKNNDYGATMRLGDYPAVLKQGSKVFQLYGEKDIKERHRHRYEVNPDFIETLGSAGMFFSGMSPDRKLMEFVELKEHPFFIATQAHPEFKSYVMRPAPLFDGLIKAAKDLKSS